jgi:ubiquinone/menaquinone biosynthesis C-methylase UbiE
MDPWAAWLLERRDGGNAEFASRLQVQIDRMRDTVLTAAAIVPGERVLDVGCGDGLLGFTALDRTAGDLHVTFSDISDDLLAHTRERAAQLGYASRCTYVTGNMQHLPGIPSGSLDVVIARSVIAYVDDKERAFAECARVLRPGGRLSIGEPVFQDQAVLLASVAQRLRAGGMGDATRAIELLHRWRSAQLPDSLERIMANPVTRFNERDLLRAAQRAGFAEVHVRLHLDVQPTLPIAWEALLASAPLPGTPTLAEVFAASFSAEEQREFEAAFRPGYEGGTATEQTSVVFLSAVMPGG